MKYKYKQKIDKKTLDIIQEEKLIKEINEKQIHKILYNDEYDNNIDLKTSSIWVKNNDITPIKEANLMKIQDRNVIYVKKKCPICKTKQLTIDHIATKCVKLLDSEYKKRHDDVVKSLHLHICNKYGIVKRIKNYKVKK